MATQLSKATKDVKKFLLLFLGFVALVLIVTAIGDSIVNPKDPRITTTVKGYPKADSLFQQIPKPQLQSLPIDPAKTPHISKTTVPFVTQPPVAYVYKIKPEREFLTDADIARNTAKILNFNPIETKIISNVMSWETPEKNRYLQYDKVQRMWSYRYSTYPTTASKKMLDTASDYLGVAYGFFSRLSMQNTLFNANLGNAEFVKLESTGQISNSSGNYNAVKVALYKRVDLIIPTSQDIPVTDAQVRKFKFNDGIANFLINGDGKDINLNLLQLSYKNYTYNTEKGVYPILTPEEAYGKIQNNQGYLYRIKLNNQNEYADNPVLTVSEFVIEASATSIIYIEPEARKDELAWTNYLQPYYLFQGTFTTADQQKGICAFLVPALQDSQYK